MVIIVCNLNKSFRIRFRTHWCLRKRKKSWENKICFLLFIPFDFRADFQSHYDNDIFYASVYANLIYFRGRFAKEFYFVSKINKKKKNNKRNKINVSWEKRNIQKSVSAFLFTVIYMGLSKWQSVMLNKQMWIIRFSILFFFCFYFFFPKSFGHHTFVWYYTNNKAQNKIRFGYCVNWFLIKILLNCVTKKKKNI